MRLSVTLHVSVWVEMHISDDMTKKLCRHAPRERVSWNPNPIQKAGLLNCHAPRERVSWNLCNEIVNSSCNVTLHVSVWVEITFSGEGSIIRVRSHAPRERVSWNLQKLCFLTNCFVTLHVSVWVEISLTTFFLGWFSVTLHVSVWVEMYNPTSWGIWIVCRSRSTWACELKYQE